MTEINFHNVPFIILILLIDLDRRVSVGGSKSIDRDPLLKVLTNSLVKLLTPY